MVDDTARPDRRRTAPWARWLWTWSALGTPLVCLAILAWGPVTVLTVAGVAAVVGVLLAVAVVWDPAENDAFRVRLARLPVRALAAFAASVAVALPMLSHAQTPVVLCVVVVGALTSPWLRAHCRRGGSVGVAPGPVVEQIEREPAPGPPVRTPVPTVQAMTDQQLCAAWRLSFRTLETARSVPEQARVVGIRQALLDELANRNEPGLRAWLASGARAASGPDRFLGGPVRKAPSAWPPSQGPAGD